MGSAHGIQYGVQGDPFVGMSSSSRNSELVKLGDMLKCQQEQTFEPDTYLYCYEFHALKHGED